MKSKFVRQCNKDKAIEYYTRFVEEYEKNEGMFQKLDVDYVEDEAYVLALKRLDELS